MANMHAGVLQSMQVGSPHQYSSGGAANPDARVWETSFFRVPSTEPRWLYTTHLAGNAQSDTKNHGSLSQAVLVYAASHYPLWREECAQPEMGPGGFAENFTVDGLTEHTVCIGDIYALGEARIQVTGARYPCWKIEHRWSFPGLTARVAETGRTGWYCAVLHEGMVEPGMPFTLAERSYPAWTVALLNDFGHSRNHDLETATAFASCPVLDPFWQQLILHRVRKKE